MDGMPPSDGRNASNAHLRDDGGVVDVSAVAPPVHTRLLLQVAEVNVPPGNESPSREVPDHVQPEPAAAAQLLLPVHHLTATGTPTALGSLNLTHNAHTDRNAAHGTIKVLLRNNNKRFWQELEPER